MTVKFDMYVSRVKNRIERRLRKMSSKNIENDIENTSQMGISKFLLIKILHINADKSIDKER